jgi:predicted MFS family arabinose efflux permease
VFGALRRSRDYRLFWAGSLIANLGLWIQTIALGWLVYALTRKASWLGTVSFVGNAPTFVLGLLGGAIADRMSRRAIMIVSLLVLASSALALSAMAAFDNITIWRVIAVAIVTGTATAVYTPAMHSSVPSLVEERDLLDAITLNSVQFNLARAVGPALAGLLYGAIGPAGCFGVNASGFLVLAVVIAQLRLPPRPAVIAQPLARALREGLGYVRRHAVIGPAIFLAAVMSLFGFPYIIMMPALASNVLGLDATGLGWLMAAVGAGAVVGGLALSLAGQRGRSPRVTAVGSIAFGLCLLAFDRVRTPESMATLLFALGALQTITIASLTTTIQLHVHDGMRGRVMSMITVIFFGFATLGGVIAGTIGDRIGVPRALAGGGAVTALAAVILSRRSAR